MFYILQLYKTDFKELISYCECSFNEYSYISYNLMHEQEDEVLNLLYNTKVELLSQLMNIEETYKKKLIIILFYHFNKTL